MADFDDLMNVSLLLRLVWCYFLLLILIWVYLVLYKEIFSFGIFGYIVMLVILVFYFVIPLLIFRYYKKKKFREQVEMKKIEDKWFENYLKKRKKDH